jgi:hypothetical protein
LVVEEALVDPWKVLEVVVGVQRLASSPWINPEVVARRPHLGDQQLLVVEEVEQLA